MWFVEVISSFSLSTFSSLRVGYFRRGSCVAKQLEEVMDAVIFVTGGSRGEYQGRLDSLKQVTMTMRFISTGANGLLTFLS